MKLWALIIFGFFISMIVIWNLAINIESGDKNAASMYFVVYTIPALVLSIINGVYLKLSDIKIKKLKWKIVSGIIPVGIIYGYTLSGILYMNFVPKFAVIGIGIINLIWILVLIFKE